MIDVQALHKTFPIKKEKKREEAQPEPRQKNREFYALCDVSFQVPKGSIVGLLGSNGAGKTTLLRILATTLKPTSGTAKIEGIDIVERPLEVRRTVGFLSGNTGLYGRLTPHEILAFFGKMYGIPAAELEQRIDTLLEELDIGHFAHRRCDLLSSGMKQRVSIARSLIHHPRVIIFDEPTTGLDVASAQGILSYIQLCKLTGKSIIFSTHHMHEVESLCDSVVIINRGRKCFEGTVEQMREDSKKDHLDEAYLVLSAEMAEKKLQPGMISC